MNDALLARGFVYHGEVIAPSGAVMDRHIDYNRIPKVGRTHLAGLIRGTGAPISSWYAFVFAGNFSPTDDTTAADLPSNAAEFTGYSEATRPIWQSVFDGNANIDNLDSKASFTVPKDTRIYGAGLVSVPTKGANTGVLLSITRFASPRDIPAGSTYTLGVGLTLVSS
ncbi:hypothetical protein SB18R_03275 [Pseudomonas oryzihabitans]|nr:hypothetical protein SB9_12510 [Pseudomonas psychrotolerans]KTT78265.1 hypothetical protein SB18R_03275 [Pseudomonas psychrotolerans]